MSTVPAADRLHARLRALVEACDDDRIATRYMVHCRRLQYPQLRASSPGAARLRAAIHAPATQAAVLSLLDESLAQLRRSEVLTGLLGQLDLSGDPSGPTRTLCVDAAVLGLLMERVTRACLEHPETSRALLQHFDARRAATPWLRRAPWFHRLKLYSVVGPTRRLVEAAAAGRVRPSFLRLMVPLNILEAAAVDGLGGATGNAVLGVRLALRYAGRASVGADGLLRHSQRHATTWADRYIFWNLCFVLQFPDYLLAMPKLLIPSVLEHRDTPGTFIHRRAITLAQQVHYAVFRRAGGYNTAAAVWVPDALRHAWGRLSQSVRFLSVRGRR